MALCPICGTQVDGVENRVCENCRSQSFTAHVDPEGRTTIARDVSERVERERTQGLRITRGLIAVNVAVFVLMVTSGVPITGPNTEQLIRWGGSFGPLVLLGGQYWRLLSAAFVHIGIIHIFFNMWCLWSLGQLAEPLFGRTAYLALYLLTGIAGNILSVAWNPEVLGAGASGAIFGVAGALIGLLKFARFRVPKEQIKPILSSVLSFAGYNLLFGFIVPGIDKMAHIGGFISGLAIGFLLSSSITVSRQEYHRAKALVFSLMSVTLFGAFIMVRNWRLPWLLQHLRH